MGGLNVSHGGASGDEAAGVAVHDGRRVRGRRRDSVPQAVMAEPGCLARPRNAGQSEGRKSRRSRTSPTTWRVAEGHRQGRTGLPSRVRRRRHVCECQARPVPGGRGGVSTLNERPFDFSSIKGSSPSRIGSANGGRGNGLVANLPCWPRVAAGARRQNRASVVTGRTEAGDTPGRVADSPVSERNQVFVLPPPLLD